MSLFWAVWEIPEFRLKTRNDTVFAHFLTAQIAKIKHEYVNDWKLLLFFLFFPKKYCFFLKIRYNRA